MTKRLGFVDGAKILLGPADNLIVTGPITGVIAVLPVGDFPGFNFQVNADTPNNGLGCAGYFQTNITGVQSGQFVYGIGSWINMGAGTVGPGRYLCAQDNGIWEAGGAVITNAKIVFGMRMEAVLGDADGLVFPFSINCSQPITALFDCNTAAEMGAIVDGGVANAFLVPFLRDLGGGTTYYLRLFNHS